MSRKKVSTTIYITPEQAERLKMLHERTKVPISVYIREGIDLMLKHYEHVLPGQMSLDAAGVTPVPPSVVPAGTMGMPPAAVGRSAPTRREPPREPVEADDGEAEVELEEAAPKPVASAPRAAGSRTGHKHPGPSRSSGEGG